MAKVIAVAVLAALVCGCGSKEKDAQPAASAAEPAASTNAPKFLPGHSAAVRKYYGEDTAHLEGGDVEAEYHQPPFPPSGGIGDTITLTGSNIGVRLRVTVTGVVRGAGPGGRYLAVKLRLRNTGIAIFESELRSVVVRFADSTRARPALGVRASCSHGLDADLRLDVERHAGGCLLFRNPGGGAPQTLLLALETVPAKAGGRWRLG